MTAPLKCLSVTKPFFLLQRRHRKFACHLNKISQFPFPFSLILLYSSLVFHCLTYFFQNFWNALLISDKYIWTLCQIALKTLLKWQWPVRNVTLLYSLLLSEDVSPTESKCKCFFLLIPICKFTFSPL